MPLQTEPNFFRHDQPVFRAFSPGDDFYEALINAHQGLTEAQSHELNAKLVLFLANHIGDVQVLKEALDAARRSVAAAGAETDTTKQAAATATPAGGRT